MPTRFGIRAGELAAGAASLAANQAKQKLVDAHLRDAGANQHHEAAFGGAERTACLRLGPASLKDVLEERLHATLSGR